MKSTITWTSLFAFAFSCFTFGYGLNQEVIRLPNFNDPNHTSIPFRHYAGHMNLSTKENMFYWYTESQENPSEDPLVLWLNGGPGCSSMGGFFTEIGPFIVQDDLSVRLNPYSWNRKANVVWLESPAGVGFSGPYQDNSKYNDKVTTSRTYEFLQLFFNKYPSLKNREFYITGESYAGMYIPYLADMLLKKPISFINLKGFAIGNPFTDSEIDGNAYMDYFYTHALISLENYRSMVFNCKNQIGTCMYTSVNCSAPCTNAIKEGLFRSDVDQFNPYYIYGDTCLIKNGQAGNLRYTHVKPPLSPSQSRMQIGPCTDEFTQAYLNLPQVQQAIHIGIQTKKWTDCDSHIGEVYTRTRSALPFYRNILKHQLNVLIYSGDADSVVNFMGTERWISMDGLKLSIKKKWEAWFGPDNQHAGYRQEYDGLTFLTVKGAGHMVPAVKPLHSLYMFECFIYGEKKCNSFTYPKDFKELLSDPDIIVNMNDQKNGKIISSSSIPTLPIFLTILMVVSVVMIKKFKHSSRSTYVQIDP